MINGPHAALAFAFVLAATPFAALAAGDAKVGANRAYTCLGCHGVPNYSNAYPNYRVPKLGGQHAEYLVSALKEYKSGDRKHPTMNAQASGLSDADIEDVAAYFAAQTAPAKN